MERTELIMGMPIKIVAAHQKDARHFDDIFDYFRQVDAQFSTYKPTSEISRTNNGLPQKEWSPTMREVLDLCQQTKEQTNGFFDIEHDGKKDPSGLVKGWAIRRAAQKLEAQGARDFYVDAGGDIQTNGHNAQGKPWRIGIRNPFNRDEIIKTVAVSGQAVATSGTYVRGQHVYNPHHPAEPLKEIMSLTVIGPNIFDADRFATAAFAMGRGGVTFIDGLDNFEGYMVDANGIATMTRGWEGYVI
jgi:thiamine biosynthesis lipoprotein